MKTVIEMALEAGVAFDSEEYPDIWMTYMNVGRKEIEAFAELVRADEREHIITKNTPEIARCNAHIKALEDELKVLREFAAIRARSNT